MQPEITPQNKMRQDTIQPGEGTVLDAVGYNSSRY